MDATPEPEPTPDPEPEGCAHDGGFMYESDSEGHKVFCTSSKEASVTNLFSYYFDSL